MKFICPLLAVADISVSRSFYEHVLQQKVILDLGANVTFEGNFAIQSNFAELMDMYEGEILKEANNFELVFEEEDYDGFLERLKNIDEIIYVHEDKQYEWGQRVIRFLDPDLHIVEVGESMKSVVKRFINQGLSVEETAKRTMHPVDFVRECLS